MKVLVFFALLLASVPSLSSPARRIDLRAESGLEIALVYKLQHIVTSSNKPSSADFATPLNFYVQGPQVKSSDRIRIVIVNRENHVGSCGHSSYSRDPNYVIDLAPKRGGFVGSFADARILINGVETPLQPSDRRLFLNYSGYCNSTKISTELAVVVNGVWQTDPINKTPNFKVDLLNQP